MNYSFLPMLCRVARTWENVNSDHADVKEVSTHMEIVYLGERERGNLVVQSV